MTLDINTPKGQISLSQENLLIKSIEEKFKGYKIIQTPKHDSADVDGIMIKDNIIFCIIENKCRNLTRVQLKKFDDEWLVTYEKILKGAILSKALCVPFVGYLYLVPDEIALSIAITDNHGNIIAPMRISVTETQATTNGGKAIRTNAYIKMTNAKNIKIIDIK